MNPPSYFGKTYAETLAEIDAKYGQQRIDPEAGQLQPPGGEDRVDHSFGGYAKDLVLAPFRGIEGAAQDLYGLADTLSGDALPDWKRRLLGESETLPGSLVEGISNFAVGFIPVYGWLGKATKIGKVGKGVVAGAAVDFALFDGNEARLSNLLEQVPALSNPVTSFLSANDDDPEIFGRLKNAVEGMGLGAIVDGVVAIKAARKARAAGKSPIEVAEEVAKAVPEAKFVEAAAHPAEKSVLEEALEVPAEAAATAKIQRTPSPLDFTKDDAAALQTELSARSGKDPAVNPREMSAAKLAREHLTRKGLNLIPYAEIDNGAQHLIRAVEKTREDVIRELPHLQTRTLEQEAAESLQRMADTWEVDGKLAEAKVRSSLTGHLDDGDAFMKRTIDLDNAMTVASRQFYDTLKKINDPALPQGDIEKVAKEFEQISALYSDLYSNVRQSKAIQGRGLSSNRIKKKASQLSIALGELDESGMITPAGRRRAGKIVTAPWYAKTGNMALEYWINAILSGPKTQTVNLLGNIATSYYRPVETMLGATLKGEPAIIRESFQQLVELTRALPEALRLGKLSFSENTQFLDPEHSVFDVVQNRDAITATNAGADPLSPLGKAINVVGSTIRTPGRALSAVDEFAKQLNYRSVVRTDLGQQAAKKGLSGQAAIDWVDAQMADMIWRNQAYSVERLHRQGLEMATKAGKSGEEAEALAKTWAADEWEKNYATKGALSERAMAVAREVTFTETLAPGTLGHKVQRMVIDHPYLRLFMPFVRTPLNILKFTGQRADALGFARYMSAKHFKGADGLNALESSRSRMVQDMISKDVRRQSAAVGRLAGGVSLAAFGVGLAHSGAITGRGPSDHAQRKNLQASGWMPYSFKVGDQYISFARMDPFATTLGIVADLADYARMAPADEQENISTTMMGVVVALANNLTNKTYLTGLQNLVEALSDPERHIPGLANRYAASLVPNVLGQATFAAGGDETLRDARTMLDAMLAKVPGLSETVRPQRNVLGEPLFKNLSVGAKSISAWTDAILPVAHSSVSDDLIGKEMAALGHGFSPPARERNGIDLTNIRNASGQDAYDRWGELTGEVRLKGSTLRQALRQKIKSSRYQALSPLSTHDQDSPRIRELKSIIESHRREAWRRLMVEFPEVDAANREFETTRLALRRGGIDPRLLSLR